MNTVVEQVADLLRDRPSPGDPPEVRAAWLARKADVLEAIAADAAHRSGLVDPVEARQVADCARQVADHARAQLPGVAAVSAADVSRLHKEAGLGEDLEEQLAESRKRLRQAADYLAGVYARQQGVSWRWDAPEPEVLAAALETLATVATTMAAEARGGTVVR